MLGSEKISEFRGLSTKADVKAMLRKIGAKRGDYIKVNDRNSSRDGDIVKYERLGIRLKAGKDINGPSWIGSFTDGLISSDGYYVYKYSDILDITIPEAGEIDRGFASLEGY